MDIENEVEMDIENEVEIKFQNENDGYLIFNIFIKPKDKYGNTKCIILENYIIAKTSRMHTIDEMKRFARYRPFFDEQYKLKDFEYIHEFL